MLPKIYTKICKKCGQEYTTMVYLQVYCGSIKQKLGCSYDNHLLKSKRLGPTPNVSKQRPHNHTIGYAYVVADLFHIGHLMYLKTCKQYCDILLVGVLTDEATMEKKFRPIIPFEERFQIVNGIKYVEKAILQDTYSPLKNATKIGVDILFESTSHTPEAIQKAEEIMSKSGGKVMVMPYYENQSSTAIKEKILKEWMKPEQLEQINVKEFNDEGRKT